MNAESQPDKPILVDELPLDELVQYSRQLGLSPDEKVDRNEALRLIHERQGLIRQLERQALLDIVVWARRPVRESAAKEQLVHVIAGIKKMDFEGLSDQGVAALARLRGVAIFASDSREQIEARLRDSEPFWDRVRRKRRSWMGSLVSKIVHENDGAKAAEEYEFLPEDKGGSTLKQRIADEGLVGGIARKIRGAADDYVKEKLDEIEARIDRKLDEIDARLAEWRDREIANRLRIIKITLAASVLVAVMSLIYELVKHRF
jgi:hypothetical protein